MFKSQEVKNFNKQNYRKGIKKMKNLKRLAATITLTGIIMMGVSSAKAGILMSDLTGTQNCAGANAQAVDSAGVTGIILHDIVGIIVHDIVGILIADINGKGCVQVDNGILLAD